MIVATLQAAGRQVVGLYDDAATRWGTDVLGVPVRGPIDDVVSSKCTHAICGIGHNATRKRVVEQFDLAWTTAVHPFSWVHPQVTLGPGTVVFAGAIVQPGARVGAHVILNTKASVDHDCRVGDFSHIAVAHLAGGASIGEGVFMALGCTVLPGLHVGDWATVGAGATVTKPVDPRITVAGVPAKPLGHA